VAITAESAGCTSRRCRDRVVTSIESVRLPELTTEVSGTSFALRCTPRNPASVSVLGELSSSRYVPAVAAIVSAPTYVLKF
jgi:hypothetical protein